MQSESGLPRHRTRKRWTPSSLVETICSSNIASIDSLCAYDKFKGKGVGIGASIGLGKDSSKGVSGIPWMV